MKVKKYKFVTQEGSMGCGVACAASLASISYEKCLELFEHGRVKHNTAGFYSQDFEIALEKIGICVKGYSVEEWGDREITPGTVVFCRRSKKYPEGHFLLKLDRGWMDPWKTGATIDKANAGRRYKFPGEKEWFIARVD